MRQSSDAYFVRLGGDQQGHAPQGHAPIGPGPSRGPVGREGLGVPARKRKRRRRRPSGRAVFILVLVIGLGSWAAWAQGRPGGVRGTIDSWIANVRGDVAKVSSDPDFARAQRYYTAQYAKTHVYPEMSDSDLAAVGVGIGVNVQRGNSQAVVIQGAEGGTTVSRLLVAGKDLGVQPARYGCPPDLANPTPWKAP